jgi:predicted DNA-binding antitoxin AbrB/MazE fold protein
MKQLEQSNIEFQERYFKYFQVLQSLLSILRYEVLRDDKADIIAYLKRILQQRTDQISELQARLEGLQQVHLSEGEKSKKQFAALEQDAARTKGQLSSENMVLTKKLDALEEFRYKLLF